jgi:hypothetical protein
LGRREEGIREKSSREVPTKFWRKERLTRGNLKDDDGRGYFVENLQENERIFHRISAKTGDFLRQEGNPLSAPFSRR